MFPQTGINIVFRTPYFFVTVRAVLEYSLWIHDKPPVLKAPHVRHLIGRNLLYLSEVDSYYVGDVQGRMAQNGGSVCCSGHLPSSSIGVPTLDVPRVRNMT